MVRLSGTASSSGFPILASSLRRRDEFVDISTFIFSDSSLFSKSCFNMPYISSKRSFLWLAGVAPAVVTAVAGEVLVENGE